MEGSKSAPRIEQPIPQLSLPVRRWRWREVVSRLEAAATSPWFAYGTISVLQAKLIWGIWLYRDFPNGDTAYYFRGASQWAHGLHISSVYSPLYQIYYGAFEWFLSGPYAVTIVHRIILVFAVSLLVVAVLRRLLPAGIAWLLSVWWVSLPIHFDGLYEVHLFATAVTLSAVLVALRWKGLAMRSTVLGILLGATVLVRFEIVVAALAWASVWLGYEVWRRRHGADPPPLRRVAGAFAAPLAVVGALVGVGLLVWASGSSVAAKFGDTQSFVLCRQFARGYEERHPDLKQGPLTSCQGLMQEEFGSRTPSYTEALIANPSQMVQHLLWNAQLAPYGLQLLLFDEISGSQRHDPDFVPVLAGSDLALFSSLVVLALLLSGIVALWRQSALWRQLLFRERAWGWVALGCVALSALLVMFMQRPRPSYLFSLGVLILALLGVCVTVLGARWARGRRLGALLPLAAVIVVALVPVRYGPTYETPQAGEGRPVKQIVDRLYPFRDRLEGNAVHLLAPQFATEACSYVGGAHPCVGTTLLQLGQGPGVRTSLVDAMRRRGINAIYLDDSVIGIRGWGTLIHKLEAGGWQRLGPSHASGERWVLLREAKT